MPPLQLKPNARIDAALEYLNALIVEGVEFPDACSRAADAFKVDHDALRVAYDEQEGEHHG